MENINLTRAIHRDEWRVRYHESLNFTVSVKSIGSEYKFIPKRFMIKYEMNFASSCPIKTFSNLEKLWLGLLVCSSIFINIEGI